MNHMSPYVSPILISRIEETADLSDLRNQPIYGCPRCRASFLLIDLQAADLIMTREIVSPHETLGVSLRMWPCLSCSATLYAAKVVLEDATNIPLRARIDTALEGIHAQQFANEDQPFSIPNFLRSIERLLEAVEASG